MVLDQLVEVAASHWEQWECSFHLLEQLVEMEKLEKILLEHFQPRHMIGCATIIWRL